MCQKSEKNDMYIHQQNIHTLHEIKLLLMIINKLIYSCMQIIKANKMEPKYTIEPNEPAEPGNNSKIVLEDPKEAMKMINLETVRNLEKNALEATITLLCHRAQSLKNDSVKLSKSQETLPQAIQTLQIDNDAKQKVEAVLSNVIEEQQKTMEAKVAPVKQKKSGLMELQKTSKKQKSLNFGVVGFGQAGGRLADTFFNLGYSAISITSIDELELHQEHATQLVSEKLSASQANIICLSLGGISNARGAEILVNILSDFKKPVVVLGILPFDGASVFIKQNVLRTLSVLNKYVASKKISNLMIVDNAKLNFILKGGTNELEFYNLANKMVVDVIDSFNTLTSEKSSIESMDVSDWAKIITNGNGITVYGKLTLDNFEEETSVAEGIIENLYNNLFIREFDIRNAKRIGVVFAANKDVWEKMPKTAIEYAMHVINDPPSDDKIVSRGLYVVDDPEPVVKVYSIFSGLTFPTIRIDKIKKEIEEIKK